MGKTAEDVRAMWAAANETTVVDAIPLEPFAPMTVFDDEVLQEAARRAQRRPDSQGKLRPTPWREEAERLVAQLDRHGRCGHGRLPGVCESPGCSIAEVRPVSRTSVDGTPLKATSVKALCRALRVSDMGIGVGSSIDSELFRLMAERTGLPMGSMPEIGEAVAAKAGVPWDVTCDSGSTASAGGSTVTGVGLDRLVTALRRLL